MQAKTKLLITVTLILLSLGLVTIINISLNFRDYSIKSEVEKAKMTAEIVKDGLTAHMVNGNMDQRKYYLDQISTQKNVKSLWVIRSQNVIDQYGHGFKNEMLRDEIDKEVLQSGKLIKKVTENTDNITLRITIPYIANYEANRADCLSCHNVNPGETLGAISMEFDITHMRNTGMITILKILGINLVFIAFILFLINHYVTPYTKLFSNLQEGITKAFSGDFSHTFETKISGEANLIVTQLNTLFAKMQNTFGDIKQNLGTFIPQGYIASADPLYEANTIISELTDIYKFKKTIELDVSKQVVYKRITDLLQSKYKIDNIALYELNNITSTRKLISINGSHESICLKGVDSDSTLCRAYRTKTDVLSSEFENLCLSCQANGLYYLCIPFPINNDYSLILSITTESKEEIDTINFHTSSIKNYLEAAKPVLESKILMDALRDTSLRDGMTSLYNRRFLEEFIEQVIKQAKREEDSYSVLMIDVDYFKNVNDTYGHDVGDKVIVAIAKVLQNNIRESDLAIRYGGEEFLLLLHNATDEGALTVASKIHSAFANLVFDVGEGETMQKTLSIGIAKYSRDGDTIWKCIKFADTALYIAKTTGRNKIVEYKAEMLESDNVR